MQVAKDRGMQCLDVFANDIVFGVLGCAMHGIASIAIIFNSQVLKIFPDDKIKDGYSLSDSLFASRGKKITDKIIDWTKDVPSEGRLMIECPTTYDAESSIIQREEIENYFMQMKLKFDDQTYLAKVIEVFSVGLLLDLLYIVYNGNPLITGHFPILCFINGVLICVFSCIKVSNVYKRYNAFIE